MEVWSASCPLRPLSHRKPVSWSKPVHLFSILSRTLSAIPAFPIHATLVYVKCMQVTPPVSKR